MSSSSSNHGFSVPCNGLSQRTICFRSTIQQLYGAHVRSSLALEQRQTLGVCQGKKRSQAFWWLEPLHLIRPEQQNSWYVHLPGFELPPFQHLHAFTIQSCWPSLFTIQSWWFLLLQAFGTEVILNSLGIGQQMFVWSFVTWTQDFVLQCSNRTVQQPWIDVHTFAGFTARVSCS